MSVSPSLLHETLHLPDQIRVAQGGGEQDQQQKTLHIEALVAQGFANGGLLLLALAEKVGGTG